MSRTLFAAGVAALTLALAGSAGAATWPDRLELPDGWRPEGIASGPGKSLYVGSIPTGNIFRLNAKTGQGAQFITAPAGRAAIGLEVASGRHLFVAGGPTGDGYVYDLRTRRSVADFNFTDATDTFVNDVTVTPRRAYFTDSRRSALYVVDRKGLRNTDDDDFRVLALPDIPLTPGNNLNGIEDARGGKTLFAIQSSTGTLWNIDANDGDARRVDLGPGVALTNGDGLLLEGRTLYVVQNRLNQVAVVRLSSTLRSGRIVDVIRSPAPPANFDVPTTIARYGNRLYLPNARFTTPPTPTTAYWVSSVRRPR